MMKFFWGLLLARGVLFPRLLFFTRTLGVFHRRPTVRIGLLGEARRRLGRSWVRPNNFASSRLVLVLRVRWRVLCPTAFTSVAPPHIHAASGTASRGRMRWHRNAPACVGIECRAPPGHRSMSTPGATRGRDNEVLVESRWHHFFPVRRHGAARLRGASATRRPRILHQVPSRRERRRAGRNERYQTATSRRRARVASMAFATSSSSRRVDGVRSAQSSAPAMAQA